MQTSLDLFTQSAVITVSIKTTTLDKRQISIVTQKKAQPLQGMASCDAIENNPKNQMKKASKAAGKYCSRH